MNITDIPGGAAEPWGGGQADVVQYGGQQPDDRGVEPGWAAGMPSQAPRLLPALGPYCLVDWQSGGGCCAVGGGGSEG